MDYEPPVIHKRFDLFNCSILWKLYSNRYYNLHDLLYLSAAIDSSAIVFYFIFNKFYGFLAKPNTKVLSLKVDKHYC